jgi:DNA-binding beta-propeller fold protein YncE
VGVSVDTDRDLAVVTNSGDNTVSLVDLLTGTTISPSPVPVGQSPLGVATLPRLGLAVVANNGSNNATVVDVTGVKGPVTVQLCNGCSQPAGVAMNQDTGDSVIPNDAIIPPNSGAPCNPGAGIVSLVSLSATGGTFAGDTCVDQSPNSAAVAPGLLNIAAIGTSSQTSSLDLITVGGAELHSIQNFQNPSGIVFDPVNQMFVVANSLANNIVIVDPSTFIPIVASVGINPTSIDYNFQTSTLVLANNGSNTISLVAYVCPPNGISPACLNPQVRDVLGLTASQQFSVSVDPKLNLAVIADQNNNRVLLVPLP